jgi:hypothetical protein
LSLKSFIHLLPGVTEAEAVVCLTPSNINPHAFRGRGFDLDDLLPFTDHDDAALYNSEGSPPSPVLLQALPSEQEDSHLRRPEDWLASARTKFANSDLASP